MKATVMAAVFVVSQSVAMPSPSQADVAQEVIARGPSEPLTWITPATGYRVFVQVRRHVYDHFEYVLKPIDRVATAQ